MLCARSQVSISVTYIIHVFLLDPLCIFILSGGSVITKDNPEARFFAPLSVCLAFLAAGVAGFKWAEDTPPQVAQGSGWSHGGAGKGGGCWTPVPRVPTGLR